MGNFLMSQERSIGRPIQNGILCTYSRPTPLAKPGLFWIYGYDGYVPVTRDTHSILAAVELHQTSEQKPESHLRSLRQRG